MGGVTPPGKEQYKGEKRMRDYITLNEFIEELKKLAGEHGEERIVSIGSYTGKIGDMSSPYVFHMKGNGSDENKRCFVPAYSEMKRKSK